MTTVPSKSGQHKARDPNEIARLVFRQVLPGDVLKFKAKSNTSVTGGGARDFRFRPYEKFDQVFERLLIGRKHVKRRRAGKDILEEIYTGRATVIHSATKQTLNDLIFEPPTTARPGEGRLCQLDKLKLKVPTDPSAVLLLIWQEFSGNIFIAFVVETALRSGDWHPRISSALLQCIAERRGKKAIQGYFDFEFTQHFCKV